MVAIPLDTHPHVLDAILTHAPYPSLLALRAVSRALRDRVDAMLVPHIALLADQICAVWEGKHVRIPRADWWDVSALADAVRIVDLNSGAAHWWDVVAVADILRGMPELSRTEAQTRPDIPLPPTGEVTVCRCKAQEEDPRTTKFHRVQLVREWGAHRCVRVASPRRVTFVPPGELAYQPIWAPVHVVQCAPGELGLGCKPVGLDELVIRAQPSIDNATTALPTVLCFDVACALVQTGRCTLVGWTELPFIRRWADECNVAVPYHIKRVVAASLTAMSYVEMEEAPGFVEKHLRLLSEDEYRAEIGEDMYALEAYSAPPDGRGW